MAACPNSTRQGAFLDQACRIDRLRSASGKRPMNQVTPSLPSELRRLPGVFRRWELAQIIEAGRDYRIEDAGEAGDGTLLFAVYRSVPTTDVVAP